MSSRNYEAEIAAFILAKGITRCPTACAAPTHASGGAADQAALRQRAERIEALREGEIPPGLAARDGCGLRPPRFGCGCINAAGGSATNVPELRKCGLSTPVTDIRRSRYDSPAGGVAFRQAIVKRRLLAWADFEDAFRPRSVALDQSARTPAARHWRNVPVLEQCHGRPLPCRRLARSP